MNASSSFLVRNIFLMIFHKVAIINLIRTISLIGEVIKMLWKLIQQGAPEADIDTFSGDPPKYHYFMEVFKEVVEKRIDNPRGRLTRLIKYIHNWGGKGPDQALHPTTLSRGI